MPRNPQVLVQIQTINQLLETKGVTSFCMDCITGPKGGCCQGCVSLGPSGCTDKPLSCSLWLCSEAQVHFPNATRELRTIANEWPSRLVHGYRQDSLTEEERLYA